MDTLNNLQEWYSSQCNGDWEHQYGVFIENLDNPGWMVTIDLADTELENEYFETIQMERTATDWIICRVEEQKFKGDGGSFNLGEILEIFLAWTIKSRNDA